MHCSKYAFVLVVAAALCISAEATATDTPSGSTTPALRVPSAYGRIPAAFEPNLGQAPGGAQFVARGHNAVLLLDPAGVEIRVRGPRPGPEARTPGTKAPALEFSRLTATETDGLTILLSSSGM